MSVGYDHDEGNDSDAACDRHDEGSGYGVGYDREMGCSDRASEDRSRHGESSGRNEEMSDPHARGHDSDDHCSGGFRRGGFHRGEKGAVSESGADWGSRNAVNAWNRASLHGACELPLMPSLLESKGNSVSLGLELVGS
jgi:hypothetical protein